MKTTSLVCLGLTCLVLHFSTASTSADMLDSWHWRNPVPFPDTMHSACFDGEKFVAVGDGGAIHTSVGGVLWDDGRRPVALALNQVISAGGQLIAVGNGGTILTSLNGFDWTSQVSGTTNDLFGVAFGNGRYIATGSAGRLVISDDGILWNTNGFGANNLNWIAFGNGTFIVQGSAAQGLAVAASGDGEKWTTEPLPDSVGFFTPKNLFPVAYGNGIFVASAQVEYKSCSLCYDSVHRLYISSNGTNWTEGLMQNPFNGDRDGQWVFTFANGAFHGLANRYLEHTIDGTAVVVSDAPYYSGGYLWEAGQDITWGNGLYVLLGLGGQMWISPGGTNWTSTYRTGGGTVSEIISGPSGYVSVGSAVMFSSDGLGFATISNPPASSLNAVAFDGTNYVAVGPGGALCASTNAADWVLRTSNTGSELRAVCRGSGRWVAVGATGAIISSPNTLAWTLRTSGTANNLQGVAFGNGVYVATGAGGTVVSSPDGANWDVQYSGTTAALNRVRFLNNQFWAVGDGGVILSSPDGASWSLQDAGTAVGLGDIAYGAGRFVACGGGILLQSTNGTNWLDITAKVPSLSVLGTVAFLNGSFWLAGGIGIVQSDSVDGHPRLVGNLLPENTGFQLKITLNVPTTHRIQVCTNLSLNFWEDLAGFTNVPSLFAWTDTNAIDSPIRLYRVATP